MCALAHLYSRLTRALRRSEIVASNVVIHYGLVSCSLSTFLFPIDDATPLDIEIWILTITICIVIQYD